jgi:hypothetical protein
MAENSFSAWTIAVGGGAVLGAASALLFAGAGAVAGAAIRAAGRTALGQATKAAASSLAKTVTSTLSSNGLIGTISAGARNTIAAVGNRISSSSCGTRVAASAIAAGAVEAGLGAAAGGLGASQLHSFDPETEVLMADGTTKKNKDIQLGDQVTATDPETGETGETTAQPVTALHQNIDAGLTNLTLSPVTSPTPPTSDASGDRSTLHTTPNHPFWDTTTQSWVHAADLRRGISVLTGPDGQLQTVTEVRNLPGPKLMRDLTVANIHTYHVIAGHTPVLVHNCNNVTAYRVEGAGNERIRIHDNGSILVRGADKTLFIGFDRVRLTLRSGHMVSCG